jgi:DNA-binding transcriptional LysR family regulator
MELRQLEYFVAVAEEAHFTRAARRLSIAQPAVSQQIRRLENELGEPLFLRDRRVSLTEAGAALLPHARAALAQVAQGREAITAMRGLLGGHLQLGLVQPLPDRRVVRAIGRFQRRYPGLELTLTEDETDALIEATFAGTLNAAFIGLGPAQAPPPELESAIVAREEAVVAVHPEHPLAARGATRVAALRDEPIVTLTRASRLRTVLEAVCREAGFAPRVVAETSDMNVMLALVAEGVGIALLPRSGLEGAAGVAAIDLTHPRVERRIVLVWRADNVSPAARAFLALAGQELIDGRPPQ